ncbi:hypothetical protein K439DRAFT_1623051 [Ramaria rubella]|nr:hypothetical protein K439DRAFT_1623051 [Ramaria rubella]
MPYSKLADLQASLFGILQANSAGGIDIALDVRKLSGIYLPSLITRVQHSDLAGKEALEHTLILVRDQAETTSIELQTFNVAVQQGLALILGADTFTIEQLDQGSGDGPGLGSLGKTHPRWKSSSELLTNLRGQLTCFTWPLGFVSAPYNPSGHF